MLNTLAQATSQVFSEPGLAVAIGLTAIGLALQWYEPQHRMGLEEKVKDGKITDDEARRQILFYSRFAPVATLLGVVVLCIVLFDLVV